MSIKHTPGPWSIVKHTRQSHEPLDRKDDFTIKAANGDSIVFEATGAHAAYATEANANLIAASPTMAEYIQRKADEGDQEAIAIMEMVHAR